MWGGAQGQPRVAFFSKRSTPHRAGPAQGMGNASGRVKCSDGSAGTSGVSMPPITAGEVV